MRAHLVQFDIAWEDPDANYEKVEAMLSNHPIEPGDLVLLPEMFDTGFSLRIDRTADSHGKTLRFAQTLAEDLGVTLQAGRTVHACHCDKADNRASVLGPDGSLLCEYTKIHPFSFGREPEVIRPGTRVETYDWAFDDQALKVCPAICYDLRFPELFRLGLAQGAEAFALGANWPDARQNHWRALSIARAIENQAYVFAVNRTGSDPHLGYAGGSIAVDPKGEIIGELGDEQAVLSVGIDPGAVRAWRDLFPAWRDARLLAAARTD